jgi:hypothetical protein
MIELKQNVALQEVCGYPHDRHANSKGKPIPRAEAVKQTQPTDYNDAPSSINEDGLL